MIEDFLERQIKWSKEAFGETKRTEGILKHINKEVDEVRENPEDLIEWIDIVILALDGYWRHGGTPEMLMKDLENKFSVNVKRIYPKVSDDEPSLHLKE